MKHTFAGTSALSIPTERLADFCRRWRVAERSLFGSALRPDFRPDSDVDLLRRLVESSENCIWRKYILSHLEPLYVAR